jgi:hypothetical protein
MLLGNSVPWCGAEGLQRPYKRLRIARPLSSALLFATADAVWSEHRVVAIEAGTISDERRLFNWLQARKAWSPQATALEPVDEGPATGASAPSPLAAGTTNSVGNRTILGSRCA